MNHRINDICEKALAGERMTPPEALELFESNDLSTIGMAANARRWQIHPEPIATYVVDRNINYTNYCDAYCTFCAFYRVLDKHDDGYVLTKDEIGAKIEELIALGGRQVLL